MTEKESPGAGRTRYCRALGLTRRWIKNCSETARTLTRLAGDVPWQWGDAEALSFAILREKAATAVEMHGHVLDQPVDMYSDASAFGAGCCITQSPKSKNGYYMTVFSLRARSAGCAPIRRGEGVVSDVVQGEAFQVAGTTTPRGVLGNE